MDVKGVSNNNSIWQAILKIFESNRTEENKDALDSVKEQIKPFFEETPDANVSLDVETKKYDKDGNEITSETPKIKDGEVGSESYIKNLFKAINEKSISEISYDESGKISSFKTEPNSSSGASYSVKYNENGTVEIHEILTTQAVSRFLESDYSYDKSGKLIERTDRINYAIIQDGGVSSEIRKYDSNGNLIETKKYDKDGNEITDTTPNVQETKKQTSPQARNILRWNNKSTDRAKKSYNSKVRNNNRYNNYSTSSSTWYNNLSTIFKNIFSRFWKWFAR